MVAKPGYAKTSGTTNDLNCVKFYDSNLGMCVGDAGTVLLSTDGGETWITKVVVSLKTINSWFHKFNYIWDCWS